MSSGLSVLTKPPEQLQRAWWAEPMHFGLLPSNEISGNVFVTKEHLLPWMSSDIQVYILRGKLCEHFRDQFLSPYSLDSYLKLKQMEDRYPKSFTFADAERMWKHYPKSQIALSQKSQSRPFTCLKYKVLWVWGFFGLGGFSCLYCCFHNIKIHFLFIFLVAIVPKVWQLYEREQENNYSDARQSSLEYLESDWKASTLKWQR